MLQYISYVAGLLTFSSFIPQAVKTLRAANTSSISIVGIIILNTGIILWMIYGLLIHDMAIIVTNVATLVFTFIIMFKKTYNIIKKIDN